MSGGMHRAPAEQASRFVQVVFLIGALLVGSWFGYGVVWFYMVLSR